MCSFFLAETCKYLYLLFDEDNFVHQGNYMFSTEGHIFPVFPTFNQTKSKITREVLKLMTCPLVRELKKYSKCHIEDKYPNHRCIQNTECGVDHNCVKRKCSQHFYCFTPSIN